MTLARGLLFVALLVATTAGAQSSDADLAKVLRAKDQALLDAIAPGDRAVWERALAPGAVYIDENGEITDRTAFLANLSPLPAGSTGHLTITDYKLRRIGDTALVVHRDDERETFHGLPLHAEYLTSEAWVSVSGEWRLAMVHAYVVSPDPPSIILSAAELEAYVGAYRAGTDLTYIIERRGDGLFGGRAGAPPKPLLTEARDLMFTPGQPRVRRLFLRSRGGRITGFIDRREGEDILWRKVSG